MAYIIVGRGFRQEELQTFFAQPDKVERVSAIVVEGPDSFGEEGRREGPSSEVSSKLLGDWIRAHLTTAQIEEITSLATSVLEDRDKAVRWLSQTNPATDNRAPIELIGEPHGFERIKNLLLRIEYGVLA